jgi:hypothetical protein
MLRIILTLSIFTLFSCTENSAKKENNCHLSDTLIHGFKYGFTQSQYEQHLKKLKNKNILDEGGLLKLFIDRDTLLFSIYPQIHEKYGLYSLSFESKEQLIYDDFWQLMFDKYGDKNFKDLLDNTTEWELESTYLLDPLPYQLGNRHRKLKCKQESNLDWSCKGKSLNISCRFSIIDTVSAGNSEEEAWKSYQYRLKDSLSMAFLFNRRRDVVKLNFVNENLKTKIQEYDSNRDNQNYQKELDETKKRLKKQQEQL